LLLCDGYVRSVEQSTRVYHRAMKELVILASLSPPRRLLAANRWRTFKVGPDRQVWEQALAPVIAAIDAGWDIARVHVEWGRSRPYGVEQQARLLCWCVDECQLSESYGTGKRGYTEFHLTKDGADE
jgi:hypothetical protein